MLKSLDKASFAGITFAVGTSDILAAMPSVPPKGMFDEEIVDFLTLLSARLMKARDARAYPDVVTFGFWLRKASLLAMKQRYARQKEGTVVLGRGMLFHIAPSNVPVNYAYSLVTGLLCGNANVVKIPSKEFPQVEIINREIHACLEEMPSIRPYLVLVRYGHSKSVNDMLSSAADGRIIWGGDDTIQEIRRSPLPVRAVEVAFADRYSLAVIDSDAYLAIADKASVARNFYNDTYLTDQNACTSPRAVIWTGGQIAEAKKQFWEQLHTLALRDYPLQPVQAVNKLTSACLTAVAVENVRREPMEDNLIVRLRVDSLTDSLMELKDNSGFFFEYDCRDITHLRDICGNTHCQTISYIGNPTMFDALLALHLRGVDRIVPVGKTMDFEFLWDGYDLPAMLTRTIRIR